MKLLKLSLMTLMLVVMISSAHSITLTFDDIPSYDDIPQAMWLGRYYGIQYGIGFDAGFYSADHTGSPWGPPRSGSSVLAWSFYRQSNWYGMMFKNDLGPFDVYSVNGYFSTEPGVVLEMIGSNGTVENRVASAFIGSPGQSWNNVYVEISSIEGIGMVEFRPVTTDALSRFCADDMTVTPIPEPTSLLVLGGGALGIVGFARRRRRR